MTDERSTGFGPIAGPGARVLVLGSLPGRASLEAGEYYAHPRNAFWYIMAALCGASGDYEARCRALVDARIAVWDVLHACVRPGSLDADIRSETASPNDFTGFLGAHRQIRLIGFNGRRAQELFERLVVPNLDGHVPRRVLLPSTSPAHAAMPRDKKLEIWRSMLAGDHDTGAEQ